jgi:SpoVK/Ycf46/Vps4 family AAA+-type ATPase
VDDAVARAGRFDTHVFVRPPDELTRQRILELQLAGMPVGNVDLGRVAAATPLFSGADIGSLVDRAAEHVVREGGDLFEQRHFDAALKSARSTTREWIATARRYVEFANREGRWDDVSSFVSSREARG